MNNNFVSLEHIYKVYPNGIEAVHDFNLQIKQHEFIVIVGPSGCGKSTTLRMVAGLEDISKGSLFIDGVYSNEETPKDRNIAMVFQSYSLYPHMTVKDNIAFGIKMRRFDFPVLDNNGNEVKEVNVKEIHKIEIANKVIENEISNLNETISLFKNNDYSLKKKKELQDRVKSLEKEKEANLKKINELENNPVTKTFKRHLNKHEIDEKVNEVSKILELDPYLKRKPAELSGGQRQRVALGRSIIRDAKVFLMDEPLSNLDAKLRGTMRSEIIKLHQKLNATIIYVTHDQTEAMTMANRIVVMKDGFIQQIGSPKEIYEHPNNTFVANFIGSPAMNIVPAKISKNKLSLPNGFVYDLNKEKINKFNDFYKNEIELYRKLINRLDTDIEEILLSIYPSISKFVLSECENLSALKSSINKAINKPIKDLFSKFEINHSISLARNEFDKAEINDINKVLIASKKKFDKLVDGENVEYLNLTSKNKLLNDILEDEKLQLTRMISNVNRIKEVLKRDDSNAKDYISNFFDVLIDLVNNINKDNKEKLNLSLTNLKNEILFDNVQEEIVKQLNKTNEDLHDINSLTDADMRVLYATALRAKGRNEILDWMLDVIDKSIQSKKRHNKLRNEYVLKTFINCLIEELNNSSKLNGEVLLGIRPEDFHINDDLNKKKYGKLSHKFKVDIAELLGKEYIVHLNVGHEDKNLVAQLGNEFPIETGDKVDLIIDEKKIHVFDLISEKIIY